MALIKCSECGKKISDKAAVCVHCGCPLELQPSPATEKPRRKGFVIGITISCIAVAALLVFYFVFVPGMKYKEAISLMEREEYQAAAVVFESLDDYKDSKEKFIACKYYNAVELMNVEQYEQAIVIFEELGAYKDCANRIVECNYQIAVTLMESEQFQEAITAFMALDEYKDTADRLTECRYGRALVLTNLGQYQEAMSIFESLDGYKDCSKQIEFCKQGVHYNEIAAYAEERPAEAAIAFAQMGDFLDARKRSLELWDKTAVRETLSAGAYITAAIQNNGALVVNGLIENGLFGEENWEQIVALCASNSHALVVGLKTDGTVIKQDTWEKHAVCDVSTWSDIVAISCYSQVVGLKADGTVVACCDNSYGQCEVENWSDIVAIGAGYYYTAGLKADGTVVLAGATKTCNTDSWKDIVAISVGTSHIVGLMADGTVIASGVDYKDECNVTGWSDIVAISAGTNFTVGLKADGTVVATGDNYWGQCNVTEWTDIVAISAGRHHVVALKENGTVVVAGYNVHGECEVGDWSEILIRTNATMESPAVNTNDSDNQGITEEIGQETEGSDSPKTENSQQESKDDDNTIDPDFKAAMDSYEEFMDEYIAFMEKYNKNPNNPLLLVDYANYMKEYTEVAAAFQKWEEEDLNEAETKYYIEVQTRVNKKLMDAAS